ncbi:MAG: VOC family protein [Hyphomicrobiaceae bacterium]|nr:VOC family protein [Hyphomicrobiaceae bacterium]
MKGITSVGHVAIKVTDVDRSLDYYRDRLGFEEMLRLHHDDGSLWLVYLRITDDQYLEIFPGAENDRAPGWNANGVNHICFLIDDLDATCARIEATGITLMSPPKAGADGNRQAWLEDPDGNRIEMMEMAPDCVQYKAIARIRQAMMEKA